MYIKEANGISDIVKEYSQIIYELFTNNSFSSHTINFGNNKVGFRNIDIHFNNINNYYSNIKIDKHSKITVNVGIPNNHKENKIKEIISHELTHVIEIIGIGYKPYPKYNNIKRSLIECKSKYQLTKAMEFITDIFYKTLDNEINANIAQTYIYIKSYGRCDYKSALDKLLQWNTYKLYDNIKNIKLSILEGQLSDTDISKLNNILINNNVKTVQFESKIKWL